MDSQDAPGRILVGCLGYRNQRRSSSLFASDGVGPDGGDGILIGVGPTGSHALDPTFNIVKVTIPDVSDWCSTCVS